MRRWMLHGAMGLALAVGLAMAAPTLDLPAVREAAAAPAGASAGGAAGEAHEAEWSALVAPEPIAVEVAGVAFEVRPARELARRDGAAAGLGIALPQISPGALLGALTTAAEWTDYRGQEIAPGTYFLRYAVEPEDGYHVGLTFYRDFALLLPAQPGPAPAVADDAEALIGAARKASGGHHPAVLALWPAGDAAAGELFDNDLGQPTLAIAVGEATLGLVLAGTGEVEE